MLIITLRNKNSCSLVRDRNTDLSAKLRESLSAAMENLDPVPDSRKSSKKESAVAEKEKEEKAGGAVAEELKAKQEVSRFKRVPTK